MLTGNVICFSTGRMGVCLIQDVSSIPDKPYLFAGQSLSVFGNLAARVPEQRQAQGLQSLCCDWKEDQGSSSKNIPMLLHLPAPQPSSLPETSRQTTVREEGQKKSFWAKCRLFFFRVSKGAVTEIYFQLDVTEALHEFCGKKYRTYN